MKLQVGLRVQGPGSRLLDLEFAFSNLELGLWGVAPGAEALGPRSYCLKP